MGAEMVERFWLFFVRRKPHIHAYLMRTDLNGRVARLLLGGCIGGDRGFFLIWGSSGTTTSVFAYTHSRAQTVALP